MTIEQQQQIVDQVMRRMAQRRGSSTKRDFDVACLTLDIVIGSGNQLASAERAVEETKTASGDAVSVTVSLIEQRLRNLCTQWRDPEFWHREGGATMDSLNCADALQEALDGKVGRAPVSSQEPATGPMSPAQKDSSSNHLPPAPRQETP